MWLAWLTSFLGSPTPELEQKFARFEAGDSGNEASVLLRRLEVSRLASWIHQCMLDLLWPNSLFIKQTVAIATRYQRFDQRDLLIIETPWSL